MSNSKEIKKIISYFYKVWAAQSNKIFHVSDWSPVYNLAKMLKYHQDVEDVDLKSGVYHNYFEDAPYRDYDVKIKTKYGYIDGYIRCCAAGNTDNPFSSFDIVVSFWESKDQTIDQVNEAIDTKMAGFLRGLKTAATFKDVNRLVKRYASEGLLIGTILTHVLANFTMSQEQFSELVNTASEEVANFDEQGDAPDYNSTSFDFSKEIDKSQPKWIQLCNDVEATVYNAVPEQCNANVSNTASMFKLNLQNPESHKIIAMERTMMAEYGLKYGDLVKIEGTGDKDGVYQIQDTMNKRFAGKHKIDILVNNHTKLGKWNGVSIYKLGNPEYCYFDLKADMANAKNQKSVYKRQVTDFEIPENL